MKNLSAGIKVGILFVALVVGTYAIWKTIGTQPAGASDFSAWARFRDASGLPKGSRVVIAGLPVGQIDDLAIDGRYARITVRIRDDIPLFENAIIFKKSSSLLGDFYLEVDPGTPESVTAAGERVQNRQLEKGEQIKRVVEATTPDELLRRIEESLPHVDEVLISVRDLSEDLRSVVNGPLRSIASRVDKLVQDESETVSRILDRIDRSFARIELIAGDIRRATAEGGRVDSILDNLDQASAEARELVVSARREVEETGAAVRERLDQLDDILGSTASVMGKIDDDQGTLGRLVNDSTIADNVEEITEDAKGFLGSIFGMQTIVGLRTEYNFFAGLPRYYVSIELQTRPDKFYYFELERGPRGGYPEMSLVYDPSIGRFRQEVRIREKTRFTFQFAKRIEWLTLRYGLKESSGGVGVDIRPAWFDNQLTVSADIFDAGFDRFPRLKVAAAYEFFGFLYVLAGVDEVLNRPRELEIEPVADSAVTSGEAVPEQFRTFRLGRDVFFGAMIRFNDRDLAALLTVGGSALTGALD